MAIIKCKMCGGDLELSANMTVAECEYCGSKQTVPSADNEKMLQQFERADWLRRNCDFDKAAGVYEAIASEFRQEAEAYWGLVLCKYGIEYVDDPATGKKIPTCHRSSYDSVLDDPNFEMALDYANPTAVKQYREEAKQFERIREGILEVSSTEAPYDIFICYKESDPNGNRTLDSEIAQNLYMALTDKGYRVFFARITLKEKLGEAYEPYIFAALNSAKVMLAIGTCYEYYNAVWVKNEWSRYLKIIAQDKSKHLIPCYKYIDAYDMPKEFKPLQAVDLGQMGAIQDIIFNMEKYIPLKKVETVVQERIVVGGSGDNKIASLLDRGNMALEDGDWAKADSFFEDVLNNDSKNAQAYLGKTLATENCRTIDAFVRKRKDAGTNGRTKTLHVEHKIEHIESMVEKYTIIDFVDEDSIRQRYKFDCSYPSDAASRRQQYREEEAYWANHKWLSKAEKFATGAMAEHLAAEKKALFAALADRVKKAEAAEAEAKAKVQAAYDEHVAKMDERVIHAYEEGLQRKEAYYQDLLQTAKTSCNVEELTKTAEKFDRLGEYSDSLALAEHCRKRADEEQAKLDAAAEAKRIADKKAAAARKKKNTIIGIVVAVIVVVVAIVGVIVANSMKQSQKYETAISMIEEKDYEGAIAEFEALGDYKDSVQQIEACKTGILDEKYYSALAEFDEGNFQSAKSAFEELGNYKDSAERITMCETAIKDIKYNSALTLANGGKYDEAIEAFTAMDGYRDSLQQIELIKDKKYELAQAMLDSGDSYGAYNAFLELNHKDSEEKATEALIQELINTFGNTTYDSVSYLTSYREIFPMLDGEQIREIIANNWIEKSRYIGEEHTWNITLTSDGTGSDNTQDKYMRTWKIIDDKLHYESHMKTYKIDINEAFYAFEVHTLAEGVYVLYDAFTNPNTSGQAELLLVDAESIWAVRLEKYIESKQK